MHLVTSRKQIDKPLGLQQWMLQGSPTLRPWLCTLHDDVHRPLGTNVSVSPHYPARSSFDLSDKLHFTSAPPGTGVQPGSTLLSARYIELRCLADPPKVPVSSKRIWMRISDPTSSRRKLREFHEASRETRDVFRRLSSKQWRSRPLRSAPHAQVSSASDAFGKGNDRGGGGWLTSASGQPGWFFSDIHFLRLHSLGTSDASQCQLGHPATRHLHNILCFFAFGYALVAVAER